MDATPLQAEARTQFGKGAARKLRRAGRIPALIYRAGGEPTHITLDPAELRLVYQRSGNPNQLLTIDVGTGPKVCLLTDTQKHPVSRELLHADLYEVLADQLVTVNVPVRPKGKSKGIVLGGKLQTIRRDVSLRCLPKAIPPFLEIDVTNVDLGGFYRASMVTAPEGCEVVLDNDYNIFAVKGRRVAVEEAS